MDGTPRTWGSHATACAPHRAWPSPATRRRDWCSAAVPADGGVGARLLLRRNQCRLTKERWSSLSSSIPCPVSAAHLPRDGTLSVLAGEQSGQGTGVERTKPPPTARV